MTTHFDEALHPRGTEGKFTTAQHAADGSVILAPPVPDQLVDRTSEALLEFFSADGSITVCSGDLGGEVEEGDFNPLWDEAAIVEEMATAACGAYRAGGAGEDLRGAVMTAIAEYAGSSEPGGEITICTRVWEAWSYGTMTAADFAPISSDDDVLADLADVVLAAAAAGETDAVSAHMQA